MSIEDEEELHELFVAQSSRVGKGRICLDQLLQVPTPDVVIASETTHQQEQMLRGHFPMDAQEVFFYCSPYLHPSGLILMQDVQQIHHLPFIERLFLSRNPLSQCALQFGNGLSVTQLQKRNDCSDECLIVQLTLLFYKQWLRQLHEGASLSDLPKNTQESRHLLCTHCWQSLHAQLVCPFQLIYTHEGAEETQSHCALIQTAFSTQQESLQGHSFQEVAGKAQSLILLDRERIGAEIFNIGLLEQHRGHDETHSECQLYELGQQGEIGLFESLDMLFENSGELGLQGEFTSCDLPCQEGEVYIYQHFLALEHLRHFAAVLLPVNALPPQLALPITLLLWSIRLFRHLRLLALLFLIKRISRRLDLCLFLCVHYFPLGKSGKGQSAQATTNTPDGGHHHYNQSKSIMKPQQDKDYEKLLKQRERQQERDKRYADFKGYILSQTFEQAGEGKDWADRFCQNSLVLLNEGEKITAFIPAYVRCHFRNMTEMDIQNLSCRFVATMNISFHLGTYSTKNKEEMDQAKAFSQALAEWIKEKLKVTFQNDFVLNIEDDLSTNVSDSDRTIRYTFNEHQFGDNRRIYSNFIVTREFKFGLRSDILFFPLEQNDLDLVTTLNSIKISLQPDVQLILRFNCMNIEMPKLRPPNHHPNELWISHVGNAPLRTAVQDLYMQENDGKQVNDTIMADQFESNKNNAFFRSVKISFPDRAHSTEFGYYKLIEKDIEIHYTREKQHHIDANNTYERIKNLLFCRKHIFNYNKFAENGHPDEEEGAHLLGAEDRSLQDSYCNSIMHIPMLKASLGTIIQICIPIFFLSFLGLVEFLYSESTSGDQVRGQKIGSSTLIVATYISFIYAMRTVIPPTPSWSIFEVAVCILAATSLLPIIQAIYASNYNTTENPFLTTNGLFIAAFIVNASLCMLIVIMLFIIKLYTRIATQRQKLEHVSMGDLLSHFTKKYFFVWRNGHCYDYMRRKVEEAIEKKNNGEAIGRRRIEEVVPKQKGSGKEPEKEAEKRWTVRFERWRQK